MRSNLVLIPILITLLPLYQAATLIVSSKGGGYSGIQEAIDVAMSGDTILVDGGTYQENLNVTKKLTLRGMKTPVVSGGFEGSAITLNADGIILEGFEVKSSESCDKQSDPLISGAGIQVNSKGNTIRFNHVHTSCCGIFVCNSSSNSVHHNEVINNDQYGIHLLNSSDNVIYGNYARYNKYGISLLKSGDNVIYSNDAKSNDKYGVYLLNSSDNAIYRNYAESNGYDGIHLRYSVKNNVSKNNATNNERSGISLKGALDNLIYGNEIVENNERGILLENYCSNNVVSGNLVKNNKDCGISLHDCCINNTIVANTAKDNGNYGIYLWGFSNNNTIKSNTARGCIDAGIRILNSNKGNSIYGNNFIENGIKHDAVDDNGTNIWDDGVAGNYYSEYLKRNCTDSDGDDICDAEYQIPGDSGAVDRYPLASPAETVSLQMIRSEVG